MANKVLLGVTGCIGAYKAAEILRGLQKQGVEVRVMMTRHATEFIAPLTFEALSGHAVITDMWDRPHSQIEHISWARWADVILIAPATANCLAKFVHGLADDFLSTVYLSNTNPVFVAPAMNVEMWQHAATQANLSVLKQRGVTIIEPGMGYQACGEVGAGRLAEPEEIVERIVSFFRNLQSAIRDLQSEHILITAGPTVEDLDPVRFITNRSSGKMGYAIAEAAQARGARVTLVSGPTRLTPPDGVETVNVRSTREMYDAVLACLHDATAFIGCAAVADFRPAQKADNKIKKLGRTNITLELETTEDIIAAVGAQSKDTLRILIGFAAESQDLLDYAERKLREKGMHAIVANDITRNDA
ncbi:MAG: bifunctional phosphopantothenoylcysteine decarboxylase/phosphopantothenate--cysteine ligase CoaBC, partial [Acidobacteria bacterium]|nr:bifunctional phosphopantothenoylcysteine decarboxylase/phosphopantothenate--cysteine ligase CoaBC [Acidobacteriota bacterium]